MKIPILTFISIVIFLSPKMYSQIIPINDYPFNHIDVLGYKIEIDLTESFEYRNNGLKDIVNIHCKVDTSEIEEIYLDAIALIIDSVFVEGEKSDFNLTGDYLITILKKKYLFGDTINLKIFYKRSAQNTPGFYFRQNPNVDEDVAFTSSWQTNTRYWLPCKDWPTDKAFVKMSVKVPEGVIVVSNGKLIERVEENNFSTFIWRDNYPMTTYNISFSAAKYVSVEKNIPRFSNSSDSIKISFYTFQAKLEQFLELLENTPQIINFYSQRFVEFPFDNLSFAAPGTGFLGMSNQTLIQFNKNPQIDSFFTYHVLPHEIAHQWFGGSINPADWNLWMTEGLASYAEFLYVDFIVGDKYFRNTIIKSIDYYMQFDSVSINNGNYGRLLPILEMLRTTVGDSGYWKSFKNFLTKNAYGSATIKEFNEAYNITLGKNYDWFFDNWFYNPGHPIYNISWQSEKIFNSYYVFLRIEQTQTIQKVFTMPVAITFVTSNGDTTVNILNNERIQIFEFRFNSKPEDVIFDKDTLMFLKEVSYETGNFTPEYSYSLKQNFPNPFNPVTKIEYRVANSGLVKLEVYDILGRKIRHLVYEEKQAGIYEVEFDATSLSSGVYLYSLNVIGPNGKDFTSTKKMLFVK